MVNEKKKFNFISTNPVFSHDQFVLIIISIILVH